VSSRGSPEGIIFAHGADEFTHIFRNPRSPRLAMPAFPSPKQAESFAMPSDDRFRFDEDESRAPLRPEAQETNPEEPVPRSKLWAIDGTFQDDDLVSQGDDFGLERETRSKADKEG
jgi:hypothetical protein